MRSEPGAFPRERRTVVVAIIDVKSLGLLNFREKALV
jgi:hypothetical protein